MLIIILKLMTNIRDENNTCNWEIPWPYNILQPFHNSLRYLYAVLFHIIILVVLGCFDWVLDGFQSFWVTS